MGDLAASLCVLSADRCDICEGTLDERKPPFHVCQCCFNSSAKALAAEGIAHVEVDLAQLLRDGCL